MLAKGAGGKKIWVMVDLKKTRTSDLALINARGLNNLAPTFNEN